MDVSASTVKAVSPLPLREDVPPKDVSVAAVKAEPARDPFGEKKGEKIIFSYTIKTKA